MTARDVDFEKERSLLQAMAEGAAGGLDTDLLRSQGLGGTKRVLTTPVGEQGPPKALRRRQKSTNRFNNGKNSSPSDPSDAEDQLDDLHRCPYDVSGCKEVFLSLAELDQHVGSKHVPRRVTDPATLADLGALKKAVVKNKNRSTGARSKVSQLPSVSATVLGGPTGNAVGQWRGQTEIESPQELQAHNCRQCGKMYASASDLFQHTRRHHPPKPEISCPMPGCSENFEDGESLAEHILDDHSPTSKHRTYARRVEVEQDQTLPQVQDQTFQQVDSLTSNIGGLQLGPRQSLQPTCHLVPATAARPLRGNPTYQLSTFTQYEAFQRGLKSGQDRTVSQRPRVQIVWPHEAFDGILGKKTYTYSGLTFPAMMAGMLKTLRDSSDGRSCPVAVRMYLDHLSLLAHAESVTQDTVTTREFNRSVLSYIESGQLSWTEEGRVLYEQLKVHFLAGLRGSPAKPGSGSGVGSDKSGGAGGRGGKRRQAQIVVCRLYGSGKCTETGDHDERLHICFHCYTKRDTRAKHPRSECPHNISNQYSI